MTKVQETIKVWLDAYSPVPKGWTHVKTQEKAITLLKTGRVEMISLDHDSGANKQSGRKPTGHKLVLSWIKEKICEGDFQPPFIKIYAHRGGVLDYRFVKLSPAQEMVDQIENLWFEKELSRATKDKDFEKINSLINTGVHISGSEDSPSSIPPLLTFSARGCSRIVKLLVDAGAENQKTYREWKWTALDLAIWNGRAETAETLRSAGLKESGPTAKNVELVSAIKKNNLEKVAFWLKSGADVNARDTQGHSCLMLAAGQRTGKRNRTKLVKFLIDAGAEVNSRLGPWSRRGREVWSDTAVMCAVQAGCTSTVKTLIDAGADVKLKGHNWTTLDEAVRGGHYNIVKLLITAGADINTTYEMPIINIAAWDGCAKIVKVLRAAGAKDDNQTKDLEKIGRLIKAAKDGNITEVNRLILAGADVNIRDRGDNTPLMNAASYGYSVIVKNLISAGADVNAQDKFGITPLLLAYDYDPTGKKYTKIRKLLRLAGAKEIPPYTTSQRRTKQK